MLQTADGITYKSRTKVLADFFRRSRDGWKRKCKAAKAELKKANNRSQWLQTSRDNWKARAEESEAQLQALREAQKATGR